MRTLRFIYIPFALITLAILSACSTSRRDLTYFQDLTATEGTLPTIPHTNTIQPENSLVILVTSHSPEASAEFNPPYTNPAAAGSDKVVTQPQLRPYVVDAKGDIDFPRLGTIHVSGMTTYQLKEYLTAQISKYVKDPMVSVELQGYRIVVMGEVGSPRTITTRADRFSILDALADAGDLTEYALRDNILVLRRTPDNQIQYYKVNLKSSDITQSPCFWLQNNDVVLVSPNDVKEDNSKYNQNSAYKLSVISTVTGISASIISLIIALAIK